MDTIQYTDTLRQGTDKMNENFDEVLNIQIVTISGAFTLTDEAFGRLHILSGTSADYTVGLPTAASNSGKSISFKGSAALTKIVTIDGNSTETINGIITRQIAKNGAFTVVSDGTNWQVVNEIASPIPYTPTFTGMAAPSGVDCWYSLLGDMLTMKIRHTAQLSTATTYTFTLPPNMLSSGAHLCVNVKANNGGTLAVGQASITDGQSAVDLRATVSSGTWTSNGSATKTVDMVMTIRIQ